jgi:hypothetical protein
MVVTTDPPPNYAGYLELPAVTVKEAMEFKGSWMPKNTMPAIKVHIAGTEYIPKLDEKEGAWTVTIPKDHLKDTTPYIVQVKATIKGKDVQSDYKLTISNP